MKTPKPKYCGQNWLEMTPSEGGRICRQCSKTIVDFTKMTWTDIEKIQKVNNNSVCGMYSPKQLDYWGQEIPTSTFSKFSAVATLLVTLAASSQSFSQTLTSKSAIRQTIFHGVVTGKSFNGNIDTLGFTGIFLKNTNCAVQADEHGIYKIDLTNYIDTIENPTLMFTSVGYNGLELKLNRNISGEIKYDVELKQPYNSVTHFYVTKPTFREKLKWRFNRWFKL